MMVAVLLGLAGPLSVVSVSWLVMARTFRRDPSRLTSLMMVAFAAKMVFFAAYVAIALKLMVVSPVPFVASFVVSFIALYFVEAVSLRRLLAGKSA
jgi:hypothetical protein